MNTVLLNRLSILRDRKVLVPIVSLVLVIISFGYLHFRNNPPKVAGLLFSSKPGVIVLEAPRQVAVNVPFTVNVIVDSMNQNVNAVGFFMKFSPTHLFLLDMETSQSFCQFYPERKFDNSTGSITLSCGSPHPGFSGTSTLLKLTFMPKVVSNTVLIVDPNSKILMSDGKGTNILEEFPQAQISILNTL